MIKDKKILVVEDSPFMQAVIKSILDNYDCETSLVNTGAEAIDVISEGNFDLIFLDCQLPVLNGYEVATEIRDRESLGYIKNKNIIIACTANSMEGDRQRCLDAGMNGYIIKPVDDESISGIIDDWLRRPAQI